MYAAGDYDLAGFAVGAVERGRLLPRGVGAGRRACSGWPVSGVHSNGFSLVRRIVAARRPGLVRRRRRSRRGRRWRRRC